MSAVLMKSTTKRLIMVPLYSLLREGYRTKLPSVRINHCNMAFTIRMTKADPIAIPVLIE
jgi:hypothetical protein